MLELRRLRLLSELHARGTIAAVADALQFTPSAVSQQLAMLEREAGVPLIERAGRGVRLTDAALVLVEHAEALLERTARAESHASPWWSQIKSSSVTTFFARRVSGGPPFAKLWTTSSRRRAAIAGTATT